MEKFKKKFDNLIIEKPGVDKEQVMSEARFTDDFGADSIKIAEFVKEFEKEFKISIAIAADRIKAEVLPRNISSK